MQAVCPFRQRLPLYRNCVRDVESRILVSARSPDLSIRNKGPPDFTAVCQWPMIRNRNIRERDPLFNQRALADVRQVKVVLRRSSERGSARHEKKSSERKSGKFHRAKELTLRFARIRFGLLLQ